MDGFFSALANFPAFLLITARMGGMLFTSPVFGSRYLPAQAKAALSLILALIVLPLVPLAEFNAGSSAVNWTVSALKELAVGLVLGYAANLVLAAVQLAGQLMDLEVGFGIVNLIDPHTGQSSPLIANFFQLLAMLLFLLTNSHHYFLVALIKSFKVIPLGMAVFGPGLNAGLTRLFVGLFVTAVKLAAPVLAALFLTNVALGVMARAVPQMNLFSVGLSLKVIAGLAAILASMPLFVELVSGFYEEMFSDLTGLMALMAQTVR